MTSRSKPCDLVIAAHELASAIAGLRMEINELSLVVLLTLTMFYAGDVLSLRQSGIYVLAVYGFLRGAQKTIHSNDR